MTDTNGAVDARAWNDAIATQQRPADFMFPNVDAPDPPAPEQRVLTPAQIIERIGLPIYEREDGRFGCPVCHSPYDHREAFGPHFRTHWREAGVSDLPNGADMVKCPECVVRIRRNGLASHLTARHDVAQWIANGIARIHEFDFERMSSRKPVNVSPDRPTKAKEKHHRRVERELQLVDCPHDGCGAVQRRKTMRNHLARVHGFSPEDVKAYIRTAPQSRFKSTQKSKLPHGNTGQVRSVTVVPSPVDPVPPTGGGTGFDFHAISPDDIAIGVVQSQINGSLPTHLLPMVIAYVEHTREVVAALRAQD